MLKELSRYWRMRPTSRWLCVSLVLSEQLVAASSASSSWSLVSSAGDILWNFGVNMLLFPMEGILSMIGFVVLEVFVSLDNSLEFASGGW